MAPSKINLLLVLTNRCNFRCDFCYDTHGEDDMSIETSFNAIEENKDRINRLVFFGGEPLLNIKVIEAVLDKYPEIETAIITNLSVANTTDILNKIDYVTTSYSVDRFKNNHDWLVFRENLAKLNKRPELLLTITQKQLEQEPHELMDTINIIDPSNIIFDRLFSYSGNDISHDHEYYERVDNYMGELTHLIQHDKNEFYKAAKRAINEHRAVYCGSCLKHKIILPDGGEGHLCERHKYATRLKKCLTCDLTELCGGDCLMYHDICAFPKNTFRRILDGEYDYE